MSYSKESHQSIREYAKNVAAHEEVMLFWNGEGHRMETYVSSENKPYLITGELMQE